jgi:hypothetical protein|tara:strand:+ start:393 stop:575 length:183 start_codon:yes stop_codon:yes gene_type:complete
VSFAYDNSTLLNLLDKRGTMIMNGKLDKLSDINAELEHLYEFEGTTKLITPVRAYITLES